MVLHANVNKFIRIVCFIACSVAYGSDFPSKEVNDLSCGPNALFVGLTSLDGEVDYQEMLHRFGRPQAGGYSLADMETVAKQFGFETLVVRTKLDQLSNRKMHERFACICYVKPGHFVVCTDVKDGMVQLIDAPDAYSCEIAAFLARWNGEALLLSTSPLRLEEAVFGQLRQTMLLCGVGLFSLGTLLVFGKRMVRKWLWVAIIAAPLFMMTSCRRQLKEESEPILTGEVSRNVLLSQREHNAFDFGSVTFGKIMSVELDVVNNLGHSIDIKNVSASCSCVSATISARDLPSGNRRKMTVNLSTAKGGEQTGLILIHTEPKRFTQQIPYKWSVIHSLSIEPDLLSFGEVEMSGTYSKTIAVLRETAAGIKSPATGLRVRTHPEVLHATVNGSQVVLQLNDAGNEKTKKGWLYVADVDMNDGEEVTFPVFWNFSKRTVFSLPSSINLRLHPTNAIKILLIFRDREVSNVSRLESDWPIESWKKLESAGQNQQIEIQFGKAPSDEKKMFFVRVYFDDNLEPFVMSGLSP